MCVPDSRSLVGPEYCDWSMVTAVLQLTLLKANGFLPPIFLPRLNLVKLSSRLQWRLDQNLLRDRYFESRFDLGTSSKIRLRLDSVRSTKIFRLVLLQGNDPPIVTVDKVTGVYSS